MFHLPRIPEPEAMAAPEEVEAYRDHLADVVFSKNDLRLLDRLATLGVTTGRALDIGTGPGQIACLLAQRLPGLHITGIDLSDAMLLTAAQAASNKNLASHIDFQRCEPGRFGFDDDTFDLVFCNSVLHHMERPVDMFREMERVLAPGGAFLVRDLARPNRLMAGPQICWYGRNYTGLMKKLYRDSVRAAYTLDELAEIVQESGIPPVTCFQESRTHLGCYRRAATSEN